MMGNTSKFGNLRLKWTYDGWLMGKYVEICWSMITMMVALCWCKCSCPLQPNIYRDARLKFCQKSFRESKPTVENHVKSWCRISWKTPEKWIRRKKNSPQAITQWTPNGRIRSSDFNLHGIWEVPMVVKPRWSWLDSPKATSSAFSSRQMDVIFSPGQTRWCLVFSVLVFCIYGVFAPLFSTASKVRLFFLYPSWRAKRWCFGEVCWFLFGCFSCFPSPRTHKRCCVCFRRAHKLTHLSSGWLAGHETLGRRSAEVLEQAWTNYWSWSTRYLDV